MRIRHKTPSIFNISMVDVLCCALGCVILLWLLHFREAEEQQREQSDLLARTTGERDKETDLASKLSGQIAQLEEERDGLKRRLTAQTAAAADLEEKLTAAQARMVALASDLNASEKRGAAQLAR